MRQFKFVRLLATAMLLCACNQVNSCIDRYEITGTVTAPPEGKTFGSEGGLTEKFSIRLKIGTAERIVNCSSTQCASLAVDDVVILSCYEEFHWSEPNEEECRFVRLK